jgi:hypothetical protein
MVVITEIREALTVMRVDYICQQLGAVVWRNNSGVSHTDGRPVHYGLGNVSSRLNAVWKSADWIGLMPDGRFLALEEKPAGWRYRGTDHEAAQLAFLQDVVRRGGVAAFVTCEADVRAVIKNTR